MKCGELDISDLCSQAPKWPNHQMKHVNYHHPSPPHLSCLSATLHQAALHQHPHPIQGSITKPKLLHAWLHMGKITDSIETRPQCIVNINLNIHTMECSENLYTVSEIHAQ